ncbi:MULTISPECIES: gas vesicle protein GvpG [Actinoalloteichus]|uniref:Gas vesicle protein G n=1 Tax=Actinoalloteichus caeruleus DSM 43889 TaxID=1120930 RepID=A0ABT1JI54_ACTCY|nr:MULTISPECIES: gas vesicle protein GvpG [Actinoalloteichus]MCP2332187.1 Gas vesicle protein G [Actinoalloteichus caeruleus DSM 43889]
MGLLGMVLGLPLAPARGVGWTLRQVLAAAEREYHAPEAVRRELVELERQLEAGLISEDEFDSREDELLDRLAGPRPGGTEG